MRKRFPIQPSRAPPSEPADGSVSDKRGCGVPVLGGAQELRGYTKASDKQQIQNRLRRIEGQVRGLQRMVEEEAYCVEVLTQIASVGSA